MLLTVCLITKDEEKNISKSLQSVIGIADEIIIYDTGSHDNTKKIALNFASQFKSFKFLDGNWEDDFSKARNNALDEASGKWIYFIDADEELVDANILRNTLENLEGKENIGGLLLELTSYIINNGQSQEQKTSILRIFRNHPSIRFSGRVHEQIAPSIINQNLKIINSSIRAIHHGYDTERKTLEQKNLRNIRLLELSIKDDPSAYNYLQLGKARTAIGDFEGAIDNLNTALQLRLENKLTQIDILNNLAIACFNVKDYSSCLLTADKSLELYDKQPLVYLIKADTLLATNKIQAAILALVEAYEIIENKDSSTQNLLIGQISIPINNVLFKIYSLYLSINDDENAAKYLRIGKEKYPEDKRFSDFHNKQNLSEKVKGNSPTTIAVCMIVKDEEVYLADAIDSCKDIVDEIIIVDTGSKDRTVEIAKSFNAEVRYYDWNNDFSAARNESIKNVKSDWILYLDADERVKPLNAIQLKESLKNLPETVGGVLCTLESKHSKLTGASEIHRGGYPRIFRNLGYPDIEFRGRVHEQITPSLKDKDLSIVPSDVTIEHLGYDRSREEMEAKVKRNYTLLIEHVKEEPLNGYAWYQLGQTLGQMNLREQSKNAIEFAISTNSLSDSVISSAYATLSQYAGTDKDFEKALDYAEKSLNHAPKQTYALNLKAHALALLGRKDEAKVIFNNLLGTYDKAEMGIPDSGYDVVLPREVLEKGLKLCE